MHLALFTSSMLIDSLASDRSRTFVQSVPRVFAAAAEADGFVWRGPTPDTVLDATGRIQRFAYAATPSHHLETDKVVQTLTVWQEIRTARSFVYTGLHLDSLGRRAQWMLPPEHPQYVLWWASPEQMPTPSEGVERLELLDRQGPSRDAFTFRRAFDPAGVPVSARAG
jgi:hypothetical protein